MPLQSATAEILLLGTLALLQSLFAACLPCCPMWSVSALLVSHLWRSSARFALRPIIRFSLVHRHRPSHASHPHAPISMIPSHPQAIADKIYSCGDIENANIEFAEAAFSFATAHILYQATQ